VAKKGRYHTWLRRGEAELSRVEAWLRMGKSVQKNGPGMAKRGVEKNWLGTAV
jgi:hypothetical protein